MAETAEPIGVQSAEPLSFTDRMNGFFNQNPLLGGILAATPWGGRIMSALGTLTLIEQRKQAEQRQTALESQLSQIGQAEATDDPYEGMDKLRALDTKNYRPDAFKAYQLAHANLTNRGAARAIAGARFEEKPAEFGGEFQIPYAPDRAERSQRRQFVDNFTPDPENPGPFPQRAPDLGQPPVDENGLQRSAGTAYTDYIPPVTRRPVTEEELRKSLSDRDFELMLRATAFKGMPPDTKTTELAMAGRTGAAVDNQAGLDNMLTGLQKQFDELPEPMQKLMAGRLQTVRAASEFARKNPKSLNKAIDQAVNFQSALEKQTQFKDRMDLANAQFNQRKTEFEQNLIRVDQQIDQGRFQQSMDQLREMENAAKDLTKFIEDQELQGPQMRYYTDAMRQYQRELLAKIRYKRDEAERQLQTPRPNPATGAGSDFHRGPDSGGAPTPPPHQPIGQPKPQPFGDEGADQGMGPQRSGAIPPPRTTGPQTRRLKSGVVITETPIAR